MKSTYGWDYGANGTNSSGFSGLPGGYRAINGYFDFAGESGYWWSPSPPGSGNWYRWLSQFNEDVYRDLGGTEHAGYSVRCVRDTE